MIMVREPSSHSVTGAEGRKLRSGVRTGQSQCAERDRYLTLRHKHRSEHRAE